MTNPTLHYVHDPLCGWCYAAGPMVEAVAQAGIPVVLHGGGLWEHPTHLEPGKRAHIRHSDARIAELAGVPFGPAYLDGLLMAPRTVLWSRPTLAAVLAAGDGEGGADLRMLRAIQHAHYVEGRRVVEPEILTDLAGRVGLPADSFGRALGTAAVDEHVAATRQLMAQAGLRGFPGFLLESGTVLFRVDHEPLYGRPGEFLDAVRSFASTPPTSSPGGTGV